MHDYKKYFALFGLSETASQTELRKAYRKLAMHYHPDKNKDPKAQAVFIQLNQAYELLLDYQKNGTKHKQEEKSKVRKQHQAERAATAKQRFKDNQHMERLREEYYFKKLTSGTKWKIFTWMKNLAFALGILLILEEFLPSRFTTKTVEAYSDFYNGLEHTTVRCLKTHDGQKMWVQNPTVRMFYENPTVQIEESFIFRNPVRLWYQELDFKKHYPIDFSANNLFPVIPLLFFIPFITHRFRRKNHVFTVGYIFSFYIVGAMLIWFLVTQDRWLHVISLGFI
jgi:hypothetical protein